MLVSGFTFIRNAIKFDYPVVEAIRSVLPLCDEFIVAAGNSEDGTRELVESIGDQRIKIIDTVWDDNLRDGGRVLAVETDKAMDALSPHSTWAFYIQADEALHEKYLGPVKEAMIRHADNRAIEGLLFNYQHFYGSYDYVGDSREWYRHEVRIIRNDRSIRSYKDAQGFRKNGRKLNVAKANGEIFHYGWVKPPEQQQAKQMNFHRYWHSDHWMDTQIPKAAEFDYSRIDSLARFEGSHPQVMQERINRMNWQFDFDITRKNTSVVRRTVELVEKVSGWRPGEYKNYRLLR